MISSNWLTIVALLSLPTLGILVLGVRKQVERQFLLLAERFGLRMEAPDRSGWTALVGTFRGRNVRITETPQQSGIAARVELNLFATLDGRILIHHRKRAPRSMLKSPILTGHNAFDRTYVVNASSRKIVEDVLTDRMILAFANWMPTMESACGAGGVELSGRDFSYSDGKAINSNSRRVQFEHALHMLSHMSDLVEPILNANERKPPQTPVDPTPVRRFDYQCPHTPVNTRALDSKFH